MMKNSSPFELVCAQRPLEIHSAMATTPATIASFCSFNRNVFLFISFLSFISKSLDWIKLCRTPRRVVAEENSHGAREDRGDKNRKWRNQRRPLEQARDRIRAQDSCHDSHHAPDQAKHHCFAQELPLYIRLGGADR